MDYTDEQQWISSEPYGPFALEYFNDKIVLAAWCEHYAMIFAILELIGFNS